MSAPIGESWLTLRHDGRERTTLLHRPAAPPGPLPTVLILHGTGGSAEWTRDETRFSLLADREAFLAVYPEGLPADPGKPAKFLTNPRQWTDGSGRGAADDVGFINTLFDALIERGLTDPLRVYVTGFSNGAGMTFRLATELAHRIAAIAPVSGHCWAWNPRPSRPVPTFYLVGDSDPLIPLPGGVVRTPWKETELRPAVADTLRRWALALGCTSGPEMSVNDEQGDRHFCYKPSAGDVVLSATIIRGLGHHWPGGLGRLAERWGGRPLGRFDATTRTWQFVRGLPPAGA